MEEGEPGNEYRDVLELQKGKNKEWLLSRATQNYMTPSLYLCPLLASESNKNDREMMSFSSVWLY